MSTLRLFFALDTPATVRTRIAGVSTVLKDSGADVKWEPPTKLHCTVKFLGDTNENLLDAVKEKASALAGSTPPLRILYGGLGCFPSLRDPRVVWAGMEDPDGNLAALEQGLNRALADLGFEPEQRAFRPHLTLGRVRGRRNLDHLIRLLETVTLDTEPALLTEMLLKKSDLHPSGSVYATLRAFPFRTR
jgi:2'-5' RNA ligase